MTARRLYSSAVVFPDGKTLWVTGGEGGKELKRSKRKKPTQMLQSSDLITIMPNGSLTVEKGPDLKARNKLHCIMLLNQTHALSTGGVAGKSVKTWLFDFKTKNWRSGPNLNSEKKNHVCGTVQTPSGQIIAVVANRFPSTDSNIEFWRTWTWTNKWTIAKNLPKMRFAAAVSSPKQNSLYLIGGCNSNHPNTSNIYQLKCNETMCDYRDIDQRLKAPRCLTMAFLVPKDEFPCRHRHGQNGKDLCLCHVQIKIANFRNNLFRPSIRNRKIYFRNQFHL